MPDAPSAQYQEITKELYSKNIDLVNANKILELSQKLYEIMITSYTIESVAERFIQTIAQSLGFSDGIVVLSDDKTEHLSIAALTDSQINNTILEVCNIPK